MGRPRRTRKVGVWPEQAPWFDAPVPTGDVVLQPGISIAAPKHPNQNVFKAGTEPALSKPDTIFFVILEKTVFHPSTGEHGTDSYRMPWNETSKTWFWGYTKRWALDQAVEAMREGYKVVDVLKGTKAHISHVWKGNVYLKRRIEREKP